jgi:hypothetical protein
MVKMLTIILVPLVLILLLMVGSSKSTSATPSLSTVPRVTPTCVPAWTYVVPPSPSGVGILYSVAATARDDVWTVGRYLSQPTQTLTLVDHWDGSRWSVIPSPNYGITGTFVSNYLLGVAALSPSDVWAVGEYDFSSGKGRFAGSLIEHWDGTQWSIVENPYTGTLRGLSAISTNDIWAVGDYRPANTGLKTYVLHWDGGVWSYVPSPNLNPQGHNELRAVAAVASNDVWAVGYASSQVLIEHWNGTEWTIVPAPTGLDSGNLYGVEAVSANDVWAVGIGTVNGVSGPLTLHWDGQQWSIVPSLQLSPSSGIFFDVTAITSDNVWAVGRFNNYYGPNTILIAHWNGNEWSRVHTQDPPNYATLYDIAEVSLAEMWVVGDHYPQYFALHYAACPQACTASFVDVPPDNTFYEYIRCLACRNVISGYADGTFRPGNSITRGQIAKTVSNAAGYGEVVPPTQQTYADVLPYSTFWLWVERLSGRGIMSGYPCGGPGEPCDPQQRPYFRWAGNATRSQLSKIVSNAAGYNENHTEETFADVPTTHPFYIWIERLASRGIIGGYACGGGGEPCPGTYFRPYSDVTRGQSAKIVANTFFPNCQTP